MAVFREKKSNALSSGFVYYKDLYNTHPELYDKISTSIITRLTSEDSIEYQKARIISNIEKLLISERRKELKCLQTGFGVSIKADDSMLLDPNLGINITSAFNSLLQTKEMFERHKSRINHVDKEGNISNQAKVSFANVFEQQLLNVIDKKLQTWLEQIGNLISANKNISIESAVKSVINESEIDNAIIEALEVAQLSGDWSQADQNNGLQGYLEILTEILQRIRSMPNHPLMEEIKKAYGFDKLASNIINTINIQGKNKRKNIKNIEVPRKGLTYSHTTKGTVAEEFAVEVIKALEGIRGGSDSIKWDVSVARTGNVGNMKADMMVGINMNVDDIISMFTPLSPQEIQQGKSVREHNIKEFNSINSKLQSWNADQFLIYTNIKEYTLVKNGKFSGFLSGAPLKVENLKSLKVSSEIIGAIVNTLKGAIGEGLQDYLNDVLADHFASFLFDDFEVIGKKQSGAQSIHMMLLSGIYVPLSVCYDALLKGFKENTTQDVFKATISKGSILYENMPDEGWNYAQWHRQREDAMNTMTVTVRIMSNFVNFMQQFS